MAKMLLATNYQYSIYIFLILTFVSVDLKHISCEAAVSPLHSLFYNNNNELRIGALFGPKESQQEFMFRTALNDINQDRTLSTIINPSGGPITTSKRIFSPLVKNLTQDDSFDADWKACNLLKLGVVGVLGPLSGAASHHVQAICDSLEVPNIEINPDLALRRIDLAINLYPTYDVLARAYIDLINAWNWTSFAVVYESSEAMIRLQDIFKELSGLYARKWTIKLFQVPPNVTFRKIFEEVKKSGENNIILDIKRESLFECLKHAQQVGWVTEKQSYLITSLDLQTIPLEDFMHGKTKITALQIIDRRSQLFAKVLNDMNRMARMVNADGRDPSNSDQVEDQDVVFNSNDILAQTALIYDAVKLLAHAIREFDSGHSIDSQSLSCDNSDDTWQYGTSVVNYMRTLTFDGITGKISFDQTGRRSGIVFDVIALNETGLKYIGKWVENSEQSLQIERGIFEQFYVAEIDAIDTLVVTTKRTAPYFMLKSTPNKQEGNDQYEGYAVDLIHELSRIVGFKYRFKEVHDGKYGVAMTYPNGTVYWNGMIGELISGQADLAIVDLTITSSREEAVDFTLPFMNTGISILFKKPTNKATTLFSFLSPFSNDVWAYVMCAYSGVSLVLFFVGRLSPYEWTNPYPCRQEDQAVMLNSFTLLNSFWFTIGSLMQQGSDIAPKSMATRTMAGIWYFFTLIMISSYTANLAAFLTVEKIVYPIENAKDLSEQTDIKYGCVESGSTSTFFRDSQFEIYRRIFRFMETHKTYVKSNEEGKERVEQGNFAFFMESTSIEYITERSCNLTQIGSPLDSKNYGIATRKHATHKRQYRVLLSEAILKLQENGMLHTLKNRWWKEKHGVGSCGDDNKGGVTELSLANVGGVFVVLVGGMAVASILGVIECCVSMPNRKFDRNSRFEMMKEDFKFAISCSKSQKPSRKAMTASMDDPSED